AVSKYTAEDYCKGLHDIFGLGTISLRYFNVYGHRQSPHSKYAAIIPAFIDATLNDQYPVIYVDVTHSRDFTSLRHFVYANLLAAEAPKLQGEVINIGTGSQIVLNDLVNDINAILGKNIPAKHTTARQGDVKHSLADIRLAEKLIGYRPSTSFHDGLKH